MEVGSSSGSGSDVLRLAALHQEQTSSLDAILVAESTAEQDQISRVVDKMMMDEIKLLGKNIVIKAARSGEIIDSEIERIVQMFEGNIEIIEHGLHSKRTQQASELEVSRYNY